MNLLTVMAAAVAPNEEQLMGYTSKYSDPFYVFGSLAVAGAILAYYVYMKKKGKDPW